MNATDGALATDLTDDDLRLAEKSIIRTPSRQEANAAETRTRNIVVAMPFGRTDLEKKKAILNFRRLKYIIEEKCQVIPSPATGMRVAYNVNVARTITNEIPRNALSEIYKADILIALLSERNFTVTYELGYRRGRDRTPVMLMVDSEDDVPVYEAAQAYLVWKQKDVLEEIDHIAHRNFNALVDFKGDIPPSLKEVVDARDGELVNSLQLALQENENVFKPYEPDPVQKLRGMLSDAEINRFYPFSVVEVKLSTRGEEDSGAAPEVVDFNNEFSLFYGYGGWNAADADRPLTSPLLLERLSAFSEPDDFDEFYREQVRLSETVIERLGFARAFVPIKINNCHPNPAFWGKSFLPCIVAQVIDRDTHRMSLLVVYIEISDSTAHLSSRGEG